MCERSFPTKMPIINIHRTNVVCALPRRNGNGGENEGHVIHGGGVSDARGPAAEEPSIVGVRPSVGGAPAVVDLRRLIGARSGSAIRA